MVSLLMVIAVSVWCVSVFVFGVTYEPPEYGGVSVEVGGVGYFYPFSLLYVRISSFFSKTSFCIRLMICYVRSWSLR